MLQDGSYQLNRQKSLIRTETTARIEDVFLTECLPPLLEWFHKMGHWQEAADADGWTWRVPSAPNTNRCAKARKYKSLRKSAQHSADHEQNL